ncbi:MAG: hypothetical protein WAW79_04170 [Steroidobacteraceae bacterium]
MHSSTCAIAGTPRPALPAALLFFALAAPQLCAEPASPEALAVGVTQLRHAIGEWNVSTARYGEDGSVTGTMPGTYRFEWVVPDRVISGRSDIPGLGSASGILFYVRERRATIEMVSVGADGHLWVMTGPIDGETRMTPPTPLADGGSMKLRFTRFNVEPDRFESRMEYSLDDGATWKPGNHQVFQRASGAHRPTG